MRKVARVGLSPRLPSRKRAARRWWSCTRAILRRKRSTLPAPEQPMQWARRSISWTSFSSPWVRARDSNRDVDLAVGRPIVPAHTGRGYRAESRTFDRRVPGSRRSVPRRSRPEVRPGPAEQGDGQGERGKPARRTGTLGFRDTKVSFFSLWTHADLTCAGAVFVGDTGFTLARNPDTVRGPDIAFIRTERLPQPIPSTFLEFASDLVVEILSPHDRPGEVLAKVGDWLDAGARLVWVVDPERRVARVYRQDGTEDVISGDGALLGEDVLPGFSCTLATVL